jgi:hypothetical protein
MSHFEIGGTRGGCSTYRRCDESQAEPPQGSYEYRPGGSGLGKPYGNKDRRHSLDTGDWLSSVFVSEERMALCIGIGLVILRGSWRYGTADKLHSCERRLSGQGQRAASTSSPQIADA